ncbi:hypothetical protein HPB48_015381 [Haemaphysalis longicornis]|uniref:Gag-like protein n=1 Tax=Haemaphysalis longicornis TaxID=44386 RepID=A0A9J6H3M7_HAELO|nr:hypothetical protein HPB48_015381 [Haemaphysalis longicornis]
MSVGPRRAQDPNPDALNHKSPKVTLTLILRPQGGFTLNEARPAELMTALQLAAHLTQAEVQATRLFIDRKKNIGIIKTARTTAAAKIDKINFVTFGARACRVCTYILPPENSCKGVIHNVRAGTSPKKLQAQLSAKFGVTILSARMMGHTETAIITFLGTHVPRTVLYRQAERRCVPHHPKAQFCTTCFAIGHRADVCLRAGTHRCRLCGIQLSYPDQRHLCDPRCVNCGKDHAADSPKCPVRRKADKAVTKAAYIKRLRMREQYEDRDQSEDARSADQSGDSYPRSDLRQRRSGRRNHSLGHSSSSP